MHLSCAGHEGDGEVKAAAEDKEDVKEAENEKDFVDHLREPLVDLGQMDILVGRYTVLIGCINNVRNCKECGSRTTRAQGVLFEGMAGDGVRADGERCSSRRVHACRLTC